MKLSKEQQDVVIGVESSGRVVKPEDVEEAARDPESPLHSLFEWDDGKAGYQWRIHTARRVIASVHIVTRTETTLVTSVGYVRDPRLPPDEQGYVAVETVSSDADLAREALMKEFSRIESALDRARALSDVFGLHDDMKDFEQRVAYWKIQVRDGPSDATVQ